MLAHRIIPTILCRGHQAVKGTGFDIKRSIGTVAEKVRVHALRGVDELVLLDVTASAEGRGPNLELIEYLTGTLFSPIAVGGGIRSLKDVKAVLRAGADKVVLGVAALEDPRLLPELASAVGAQALVASVDVKGGTVHVRNGTFDTGQPPHTIAPGLVERGAGEILLQSVERDGTMQGYDLELIRRIADACDVPVIASGGCSSYEDMRAAIAAGASAVAAGALFQFTDATPKGAAQYLATKGVEVRC